jgi:hypothetical protein
VSYPKDLNLPTSTFGNSDSPSAYIVPSCVIFVTQRWTCCYTATDCDCTALLCNATDCDCTALLCTATDCDCTALLCTATDCDCTALLCTAHSVTACFSLAACPEASICNILCRASDRRTRFSGSDSGSPVWVVPSRSTPIKLAWLCGGEWLVLEPRNSTGKCDCVAEMWLMWF